MACRDDVMIANYPPRAAGRSGFCLGPDNIYEM